MHRPPTIMMSDSLINDFLGNPATEEIREKFMGLHEKFAYGQPEVIIQQHRFKGGSLWPDGGSLWMTIDLTNETVVLTRIAPLVEAAKPVQGQTPPSGSKPKVGAV